ncbi:hypothetical protein GQ43DRAFT_443052 [Delitschia confertaspora ATCC 74209]|uniref:2,6-dihydroxypyridine 3-monooxygenase substrate binding domain-containing protein n=1 Tax=Delitschia confertaspora ATCC 74209 TaxID=1513339 RepID=A0A9P4MQB9_9PLEO|nr:hypothetical protein GQ43DRAFT_443052 [Delitschia confertaspora ATCC 74209]
MHKVDRAQNMTSWDLVYHMLRANFDGVRSEYCRVPEPLEEDGPVVHLHGHTVKGAVVKGDKVEVMWKSAKGKEGSTLADFVVAADGPSSTIRDSLIPTVNRMYAGYCALRGTVPESDLSVSTREAFCERFTFFHAQGIQVLAYLIPGESGALEPGKRLINFVYYTNFPAKSLDEPSPELAELMTDVHGVQHRISMPPGKIDLKAWEKQLQIAKKILPPPFVELVSVTKKPFVQAITDVLSPENELMGGKVVLVGDALAGFRPHTAASTSQAAFDAMILADMIAGKVSREEWKRKTMEYARTVQKRGVEMGDRSQFEKLPPERYFG